MFIAGESFLEHCIELPGSYLPGIRHESPTYSDEREIVSAVLGPNSCTGALHRPADVFNVSPTCRGAWRLVCTCGIAYRALKTTAHVPKKLRPTSYGPRYRSRFRALVSRGASIDRAAQELHLDPTTARYWAQQEKLGNLKMLPQQEVRKLRSTWRRLVENISSKKRITAAVEANSKVYAALLKNDRDWLLTFNRRHRSRQPCRVYEPTSDEIRDACRQLMLIEPPIRATKSAILDRGGFRQVRTPSQSFSAVLAEVEECQQAYRERVISWLVTLASEQRLGDCDEAIHKAGLRRTRFTTSQRQRIREIELLVHSTSQC
ncbi:TnsD family Tn7-like transposition protein [Paraburkholderia caribensis]|uniref:TnsD family Tn7-like transposition protein n=1 Tax=Paraburkholderia caribensis TaxID=75105 RepID=UPI0009ECD03F|nr:TnsD family Tn7-like transposition protein [Paraburkholderia caribensis]